MIRLSLLISYKQQMVCANEHETMICCNQSSWQEEVKRQIENQQNIYEFKDKAEITGIVPWCNQFLIFIFHLRLEWSSLV